MNKKRQQRAPIRIKGKGGKSRDSRLSNATGISSLDKSLASDAYRNCDALLQPIKVVYFKKKNKRGDWYNGRVESGEKCSQLAIVSFFKDGKRVHRCAQHLSN